MNSLAWYYYHAIKAGLTYKEAQIYPVGVVQDMIACWLIEERGFREVAMQRDVFDI